MARGAGVWATMLALAPTLAWAASARELYPAGAFKVTNDSHRVVECLFLVDGKTRNYLKIRVGKTYASDFDAGRLLQLSCIRSRPDVFGPLKTGIDYRLRDDGGDWVGLAEGPATALP